MPRLLSKAIQTDFSASEARRIALAAQGFDRARPSGPARLADVRRVIRQLGLLQIDYVNVLVPAHYQVLFSRLGPYKMLLLDDLVYRKREFTEQWAHEASIVPVELWPLLRHRRDNHRVRPWGFEKFLESEPEYVSWVLDEVSRRGPISGGDLPARDRLECGLEHSWFSSVARAVLESHFGRGALAVANRLSDFTRVFDLAERVIAQQHLGTLVNRDEAERELLQIAARAYGVATAQDLADYFRMPISDARARLAELVASGDLREVRVEGWRHAAYLEPGARIPEQIDAASLLSPFDPMIWHRPRAARLFDFDYRVEIFVPREKRRWGYYVLPFLLGERLVARVDLKSSRADRTLSVLASFVESHANGRQVADALARELKTMARWLGLDHVKVHPRGDFATPLAKALREVRTP